METVAPILDAANNHPYFSAIAVVLGCAALVRVARGRRSDLPPGPKGYPIVGNLFDLPPTHIWEKFAEFGEQYGALSVPDPHSIFTFAWADTHEFTRRRNHVPQRPRSEDDSSQFVQSRRRSP